MGPSPVQAADVGVKLTRRNPTDPENIVALLNFIGANVINVVITAQAARSADSLLLRKLLMRRRPRPAPNSPNVPGSGVTIAALAIGAPVP